LGTYENWEEKEEKCERKRKKARQKITGTELKKVKINAKKG
jgi:hypothetical protein